MKRRVAEARSGACGLDHEGFGRLSQYIQEFPDSGTIRRRSRVCRLLRDHGHRGRELMHTLEAHHLQEYELGAALQKAWAACGAGPAGRPATRGAAAAVESLADHVWEHMRLHEESLLPLALQCDARRLD